MKLKGLPASKGVAEGRARVIKITEDIKEFREGEVLISKTTDPNFTPVFLKCKAIATETGGLTSHTAIIAREMNIPCVVGVASLLEKIKTGDLIRVDAYEGTVRKL